MELLSYFLFGAFLWIMAYFDLKLRKVPDLIASLFWVFFAIEGLFYPSILPITVELLAGFYFLMVIIKYMVGVQGFGWMDIILLPPCIALIVAAKGVCIACGLLGLMFLAIGMAGLRQNNIKYGLPMVLSINASYESGEPLMLYLLFIWILSLFL